MPADELLEGLYRLKGAVMAVAAPMEGRRQTGTAGLGGDCGGRPGGGEGKPFDALVEYARKFHR